ncbi:MAG TPA: hypothetical protein PKE69_27420 [Pyrinomonadaceae bacterium]|nr:hypothetical protein [Pyrinomonadaceae bacterium]
MEYDISFRQGGVYWLIKKERIDGGAITLKPIQALLATVYDSRDDYYKRRLSIKFVINNKEYWINGDDGVDIFETEKECWEHIESLVIDFKTRF